MKIIVKNNIENQHRKSTSKINIENQHWNYNIENQHWKKKTNVISRGLSLS